MQQLFEIFPSRHLKHLLLSAHLLAVISIVFLPLPLSAQIVFVGMILLSLIIQFQRVAQPKFSAIKIVAQQWVLVNCEGLSINVTQLGNTLVTPSMIIFQGITAEGTRQSLLLMSDSLEKQAFRRLRVLLRWGH
jgi:hypothetical protein